MTLFESTWTRLLNFCRLGLRSIWCVEFFMTYLIHKTKCVIVLIHDVWGSFHKLQIWYVDSHKINYIGFLSYFQTFLNQKHGYRPLQTFIPSAEFELLTSCLKDHGKSTSLLETWYLKDTNDIPPVYILQPISTIIPGYKDKVGTLARKKGCLLFNP